MIIIAAMFFAIRILTLITRLIILMKARFSVLRCFSFYSKNEIYQQIENVQKFYGEIFGRFISEKTERETNLLLQEPKTQPEEAQAARNLNLVVKNLSKPLLTTQEKKSFSQAELFDVKSFALIIVEIVFIFITFAFYCYALVSCEEIFSKGVWLSTIALRGQIISNVNGFYSNVLALSSTEPARISTILNASVDLNARLLEDIYLLKTSYADPGYSRYFELFFSGNSTMDDIFNTITCQVTQFQSILSLINRSANHTELIQMAQSNSFQLIPGEELKSSLEKLHMIIKIGLLTKLLAKADENILTGTIVIVTLALLTLTDFIGVWNSKRNFTIIKNLLLLLPYMVSKTNEGLQNYLASKKFKTYFR